MIPIFRISITKDQFLSMEAEERRVVLVGCHILNQINVFYKLTRFSSNLDGNEQAEIKSSAMQTQIIAQALAGAVAEASKFLVDHKNLIERYFSDLPQSAQNAFAALQTENLKKDMLRIIRHNYIYHLPNSKLIDKAVLQSPDGDDWCWYLSEHNTNSMFLSSEMVVLFGIIGETGKEDFREAFGQFLARVVEVSNALQEFIQHLCMKIVEQRFGLETLNPVHETTIYNAPALLEFKLPFYAEAADDMPAAQQTRVRVR